MNIVFVTNNPDRHNVTLPTINVTEFLHQWNSLNCTSALIDTETTGLHHRKNDILLVALAPHDCSVFYCTDYYSVREELSNLDLSNTRISGHNLGFDLPFMMSRGFSFEQTKIYDTMIVEQILVKGTSESVSLKNTVKRRLGIDTFDKKIREEFILMSAHNAIFEDRHIKYACEDLLYLPQIESKQHSYLEQYNQHELAQLNNETVYVVSKMKVAGMPVDKDEWIKLYYENIRSSDQLEVELDNELTKIGLKQRPRVKERTVQLSLIGEQGSKDVVNKNIGNINYGSPRQLLDIFYALKLPRPTKSKEDTESMGEASIRQYMIGHKKSIIIPFLVKLLEYKDVSKQANTFGKSWIEKFYEEDGVVRADFKVNSTTTGRFACIEENQLVMTVGGSKPIKKIKVGEYVYSYDDQGKIRINKVIRTLYQGYKKTIKIHYSSQGNGSRKGSIVCTPDHLIRVNQGEWKQAKDLTKTDKIWYCYRNSYHSENDNIRPRLYGVNSFMEKEQDTIKREFFKVDSKFHLHHIDINSANNRLDNLTIMTAQGHSKYHALENNLGGSKAGFKKGEFNTNRSSGASKIVLTRYQLLRMIYATDCKPTKVVMDFQTFKDKCIEHTIDLKEVSKRFSTEGYISKTKIKTALFESPTTEQSSRRLRIGTRRLSELCKYYGIEYSNHKFDYIEEMDYAHVYDLSIENNSNFIVEELNVKNCSSPNLQQIPAVASFRHCFKARPDHLIWTADYASAELRIMASLSGDSVMLNLLSRGADLHGYAATKVYRYLYNDEDAIVDKENHASFRTSMKNVIFGLSYGAGVGKIAELLDISRPRAEKVYELLANIFPQAFAMLEENAIFGSSNGYIVFDKILNQRRWFPDLLSGARTSANVSSAQRASKNSPIQGVNGQMVKKALCDINTYIETLDLESKIVSTVHDEIVIEVPVGEKVHGKAFAALMKDAGTYFLEGIEMGVDWKFEQSWSK